MSYSSSTTTLILALPLMHGRGDLPVVVDVEASGFGAGGYPLEIGGILPDGRGFCLPIRPQPGWTHWDEGAERLHGITRERLQREGLPALEVCLKLNSILGRRTVCSDAWHLDQAWIDTLYDSACCRQSFRVQPLQKLFVGEELERWNALLEEVRAERPASERHRAATDAAALQQAYARLRGLRRLLRAA